ncbi:NUDIX hydrolase [Fortiea sp. LEGE XX443]|uniref:NUDIX hydrolase n=1 Tax=Fortiea sp. LEGE XX443 TaxID=1828611 RepID=UPI00187E68A5|nr:NUDIX hydrolase [Fortiea sp. LEGE XX443]MBE9007227.1 NUDIX hydrolase [Fortiea sp. LEGE XX443]
MNQKISKIFKQSGVIPYRMRNGNIEILLITTRDCAERSARGDRNNWVIPKGGITKGMSPPASAAKEAWEEAGIIGQVDVNQIGSYRYRKRGKIYRVQMYLLLVEILSEEYPEAGQRQREWLDITIAMQMVKQNSLKRILNQFLQIKSNSCQPFVSNQTSM